MVRGMFGVGRGEGQVGGEGKVGLYPPEPPPKHLKDIEVEGIERLEGIKGKVKCEVMGNSRLGGVRREVDLYSTSLSETPLKLCRVRDSTKEGSSINYLPHLSFSTFSCASFSTARSHISHSILCLFQRSSFIIEDPSCCRAMFRC